jgi:hypothetical protein
MGVAQCARTERELHARGLNDPRTCEERMPAKSKNTQRNKAPKTQRRAHVASPPTNVDLRAGEAAQLARREPVVTLSRGDTQLSHSVDAMERAIAKEDAKIIAKASARALRRGLH